MYQWEQPRSGRIQLSGHAPAWYRGVHAGPRVLVFDNGKLIDDTAVEVSEVQRQWLREQALGAEASDKPIDGIATLEPANETASLQIALTEAAKAGIDIEELATATRQEIEQQAESSDAGLEDKVNELKALLSRWDAARTTEARAIVNGDSPPAR